MIDVPARFLVASLLLSVGCIHELPPPPTPGPIQPPPLDRPVPPGDGRIYLDVVDGPSDVRVVHPITVEKRLNHQLYEDTELETVQTCTTPCVLDLPLGHQLIAFPIRFSLKEDVEDVLVSPTPSLYRRALGSRQRGGAGYVLGILGVSFGGSSLVTGAALLPVGLATDRSGMTTAGAITLGAGAILTAISIWALAANPTFEQPGAGAHYDLAP
jgi:hypothetical protein